jgi:hypothetical protein
VEVVVLESHKNFLTTTNPIKGKCFMISVSTMANMAKVYSHPGVTHHFILDVTTSCPGT